MSRFNPKVWASAPTTFGWRIGNSGEPRSTVQGDGQAGRIPRSPVLSIVLARAGCVARSALDTEDQRAAPTSFPQARWNEAFAAEAFACSV